MSDVLMILVEITLTMAAVIALLLLLGPLLARRYATRWRYWAWLLVALRLLIPFRLSLPQAPVQLELPGDRVIYTASARPTSSPARPAASDLPTQSSAPSTVVSAPTAPTPRAVTLEQILFQGWAVGTVVFLIWHLVGWLRFARWLRRWAAPAEDAGVCTLLDRLCRQIGISRPPRLLICPSAEGPMLAGLFHPVILLPPDVSSEHPKALWFALRHELTHLKRRDIWYKALLLLANAVHWFNPLVWIMRRAADRDLELCCDAGVVRGLSPEDRAAYGDVIMAALRRGGARKEPLP